MTCLCLQVVLQTSEGRVWGGWGVGGQCEKLPLCTLSSIISWREEGCEAGIHSHHRTFSIRMQPKSDPTVNRQSGMGSMAMI